MQEDNTPYPKLWSKIVYPVFGIGLIIRIIAFLNTHLINPDGTLYIYQAKAIYYGQWTHLTDCGLGYVSIYPILVALSRVVFRDWLFSAQFVSFVFGFGALFPLYYLLRRFYDPSISAVVTLIYALTPVFVRYSVDVMRDPVYWFFLVAGIYFFVNHIPYADKKGGGWVSLVVSSTLFIMATWARVEALMFLPISCAFLLFTKGDKKIRSVSLFLLPIIIGILIGWCTSASMGRSDTDLYRINDVLAKSHEPVFEYRELRSDLKTLADTYKDTLIGEFIQNARTNIWLIALGTILNRMLEAFFYPYFLVYAIGLICIRSQLRHNLAFWYLITTLVFGFLLLYAHTVQKWVMTYRFIAILIIPSCVLAGIGVERTIHFAKLKFGLRKSQAIALLATLILVFGLAKNLREIDKDKAVYREIAERIAIGEGDIRLHTVAALPSTLFLWISFYSNVNYPGVFCPMRYSIGVTNYEDLIGFLKKNNIKYFLWEEKRWQKENVDFFDWPYRHDFAELGRWYHPDTGKIILFENRQL